ncbi:MAG: molybdopterin-guanine dinucleotide biosynthesis protein B [Clostridiales Family XIII bacterium]|nr:molybdopterin-guanine dinucleotide biosynthesis protein B [Clostridiales Family XIII bacterium]
MKKPFVVAVSGRKNSGKTTCIERLLPLLAEAGVQTAVIKHHGHDLDPDVPGTDTYRFFHVGAVGAVITDDSNFMLVKRSKADERALMAYFPEADLILLEGYKRSAWPKIEMLRHIKEPDSDPSTLIAVVSDDPACRVPAGTPIFRFGDCEGIAALLLRLLRSVV